MSDLEERFWSKVDQSGDDCWHWQAAVNPRGYGVFAGRNASRVAWELTFGPIPAGLWVLHACDNPLCVRPGHLMLGSPTANVYDMDAKGRRVNTARRGVPRDKLTPRDADAIRYLVGLGHSHQHVADQFGISRQHVGAIVRGTRRAA